ncbi:hypothetical protein [Paenibacillus sp. FSL K6-2524]|uniref:hypothetical protein n=1 Tax=Paenibacillus sp. FSL K6-2524 TaxID=2954516 RepID=UPI0030F978FD
MVKNKFLGVLLASVVISSLVSLPFASATSSRTEVSPTSIEMRAPYKTVSKVVNFAKGVSIPQTYWYQEGYWMGYIQLESTSASIGGSYNAVYSGTVYYLEEN